MDSDSDLEVEQPGNDQPDLDFRMETARTHPIPQLRFFLELIYTAAETQPWLTSYKGYFCVKNDDGVLQLVRFRLGALHPYTMDVVIGSDEFNDLDGRLCTRIAQQENFTLAVVDSAVLLVDRTPRRRSRLRRQGYELAVSIQTGYPVFMLVSFYSVEIQ
ncbi:Oidioi.mRNA.OKI2018_I69.chr1.g2978.t1.cds [Oikopleura dioica]|uniref:Oidioi.mRNA.OKI2018_I69.chr1.g2978.t1.cds n=1 Tax=Oikopleura dioica TaxID=34765 RepID=A0ABN7STC9_OIKDI|nr:Oidioi.mRNA.OKI2018_I69.chr1.g2978.t1.cds [Oikopleura dioica]